MGGPAYEPVGSNFRETVSPNNEDRKENRGSTDYFHSPQKKGWKKINLKKGGLECSFQEGKGKTDVVTHTSNCNTLGGGGKWIVSWNPPWISSLEPISNKSKF